MYYNYTYNFIDIIVYSQRLRDAQASIKPQDMFTGQTDKYSKFDEDGLPTHNHEGEPLGDKQIKKLQKLWTAQDKKYKEFVKKGGASNVSQ